MITSAPRSARRGLALALLVAGGLALTSLGPSPLAAAAPADAPGVDRVRPVGVSVGPGGRTTRGHSAAGGEVSDDGRWAVFEGYSERYAGALPEDSRQIFLRDLERGVTRVVSTTPSGAPCDCDAREATISADGRFAVYQSNAQDLVTPPPSPGYHVYRTDLGTGTTVLVDRRTDGTSGDGDAEHASISADGSVVAFSTESTNLVVDDTDDRSDVLLADLGTGTLELVSTVPGSGVPVGGATSVLSADGLTVGFASLSPELVEDDENGASDVFVRDRVAGTTILVSEAADGGSANGRSSWPSMSADGAAVVFQSFATDLGEGGAGGFNGAIWLRDLAAGTTTAMNVRADGSFSNDGAYGGEISADGGSVTFMSYARDLLDEPVARSGQVYLRDLDRERTRLVSARRGESGDHVSVDADVSADGSVVVFRSSADNLLGRDRDRNRRDDVFAVRVR